MREAQLVLILFLSVGAAYGCGSGGGGGGSSSGGSSTDGGGVSNPGGGGGGGGGGGDFDIPDLGSGGGGFTGDTPGGGDTPPNGGGVGDGDGTDTFVAATGGGGIVSVDFTGVPNSDGDANIFIDLTSVTSFQVVTQAIGHLIGTAALFDPTRNAVVSAADNPLKTLGTALNQSINTLPYRTRGDDTPVVNGRYQQLLFVDAGGASGAFNGTLVVKNDPDNSQGTLVVNLFLVGDSAQTGSVRAAVDRAIALWRAIYARINITLDIMIFDIESNSGVLPNPTIGSDFYLSNATEPNVRPFALNVYLGESVSNDATTVPGNELIVLGVASSIPGPSVPTIQSATAVSLGQHAGPDGVFSDDEQQLLGETVAHEGGHYLGLFHPVENDFVTGGFVAGDPLADTPECTTEAQCINNGLAMNNMFPRPVPNVLQQNLSADQGEVINLQVIVD